MEHTVVECLGPNKEMTISMTYHLRHVSYIRTLLQVRWSVHVECDDYKRREVRAKFHPERVDKRSHFLSKRENGYEKVYGITCLVGGELDEGEDRKREL